MHTDSFPPTTIHPPTATHPPVATLRTGFTLVELLVVIAIIGILVGLLIPAVSYAFGQAKQARITIEIANIEKALERYKIEYGEYPPDFSEVTTLATTPDARGAIAKQLIDAHLARVFRYRDALSDLPRAGNLATNPVDLKLMATLDPSEALYVWLRGFDPDPQNPVFGTAGERAPLFDFDKTRLGDFDSDNFPEYYPKGSAGKVPYLYFSSNPNSPRGLAIAAAAPSANPVHPEFRAYAHATAWATSTTSSATSRSFIGPYFRYTRPSNTEIQSIAGTKMLRSNHQNQAAAPFNTPTLLFPYASHDKFQLISAGLDDSYGLGGNATSEDQADLGNFGTLAYPRADRDNITNFAGGTLQDAKP